MRLVIDCSVAFKWEVFETLSDRARLLRSEFDKGAIDLIAPDLFPIEIANSLTMAERRGRISVGLSSLFLADILSSPPTIIGTLPDLLPRAQIIAATTVVSVYDALYVALAERESCELITADDKLVRNLQAKFPMIRHLQSF